ncbi:mandelate racemase/muconate lactonizing enzyme family protein [Streptosporangium sp. NBC_01756]|uniref:mandelate racemase/muconate lactonizing enzyme family protein n=1 Tax=Streptosporangium sp. NBC_01756 TaxID=2975950 RepID=UPI002DD7D298|nr:mandelate racemase/muconate lactonizing enzyme family protein [Streptosporangium sp. NBC_01756]WSC85697.1 mandelate racemase/muconate lactonizing enzyme family protein [Streptosporangium sp. NBC_01756]
MTETTQDPISSITVTTRTVPLPRPLQLGSFVVTERTYALVHVTTRDGFVGCAYAQTRGAPIAAVIETLFAPLLTGKDSLDVEARWRECFRSTLGVGRTGLVPRALSLVDIALWDVRAQRAARPLFRLLGGEKDRVPLMLVAGYPHAREDVDEIVETAVRAADKGYSLVKIARAQDASVTRHALSELAISLPDSTRVVVDASWFWENADQALAEISNWREFPIAWVEDPFPPENVRAYQELHKRSDLPIGVGDEVTDIHAFDHLAAADGLDILRLDVATIGGITPALGVARSATSWGLPVSMHISPEVSAHLAAALPGVTNIETFDRSGNRYDPSHELCTGGPEFGNGTAKLRDVPGLGFTIPR